MHDQLPNIEVYKILEEQGLLNEQQKEQYEELKGMEATASKVLVIAGSYDQFRGWINENQLNLPDYKYIATHGDLLGYSPNSQEIELVGTWYTKDIPSGLIESIRIEQPVKED